VICIALIARIYMHHVCALTLTAAVSIQGNHHIKGVGGDCVDSKPTLRRPPLWFTQRYMLTGFANTLDRSLCNCKFFPVGHHTILLSLIPLRAGTELFAVYKRTD
jgi:hypothetical protein